MAYTYYQQATQPGWGTSQYQFGPPPPVTFQPQPSWGGPDFYRAHAATSDPYLFDHAWSRVRQYGGAPAGGMGVGLHEARHWHRRAYGPQNEIAYLAPEELGHAAAYEAYRSWIYNKHMYEPLSGDIERQREALTGLAVAEATRLLQFSAHTMDQYARLSATEAAAHTANYIFYQTREDDYRSRSRFRTNSLDDPYARDDELLYPFGGHSARSRSRHARSHSRHRSFSQPRGILNYPGQGYSSSSVGPMPPVGYPGQTYSSGYGTNQVPALSGYGVPMSAGSAYGMPLGSSTSAYGTPMSSAGSAYGAPMGMSTAGSAYGAPMGTAGSAYGVPMSAGSAYGAPMGISLSASGYNTGMVPGIASSYSGSSMGGGMYPRTRSNSFSYPTQQVAYNPQPTPYMGSAMSMPSSGGQTIIIQKPRKHKHKRSRSSDADYNDTRSHHSSRY